MSTIELLQIRALQKTCDRLDSELMLNAAEDIMELEDTIAYLKSVIEGYWPGSPECDLNETWNRATVGKLISDSEFDLLFSTLDDRILFNQLAKHGRSVTTNGGVSYSVIDVDDLRAVVKQHLYEQLTGEE